MSTRPTLVIGNRRYSSWSLRPWLLLRHFDVDFDTVVVPLDTPTFAGEVARWSPSGRVPALASGDISLWDSLAICEYANETLLGGRGWPVEPAARAMARSITAEMHSGFAALRGECPMNLGLRRETPLRLSPAAQADLGRVESIWRGARTRFGAGGALLFGAFSIADAFYAPVATRIRSYALPVAPDTAAYVEAIFALPAMRAWIEAAAAETERIEQTERVGAA
jgi:glutathione S-transferase